MSVGHPQLTIGIPVGFPTVMETHGSEFVFRMLQVLATSTCETKVLFIYFTNLIDYCITHFWYSKILKIHNNIH